MPQLSQEENSFYCPITGFIFFEPVFLNCNNHQHTFEKEALEKWLLEYQPICPLCKKSVHTKNEIHFDEGLKRTINEAIQDGKVASADQYLPRQIFLDLLSDKLTVQEFCAILINHPSYNEITSDKDTILRHAIKERPELLAYFLLKGNLSGEIIAVYLCDKLNVFNKSTINACISRQLDKVQYKFSVAYWLMSDLRGRKILAERKEIRNIVGEALSAEHLNAIDPTHTHFPILYYFFTAETGKKIWTEYPALQAKLDKNTLLVRIDSGPLRGKCLQDLYTETIPQKDTFTFKR